MILLELAFFFRDSVELVALAAVCESCCVATLFAGCFMKMSVAVELGRVLAASQLLYRRLILRYIARSFGSWTCRGD